MKTSLRLFIAALGVWVWGLGLGVAQAGVILPVDPATLAPISGSPVTFSIFKSDGAGGYVDATDTWLPSWNPVTGGQPVYVVVNLGGVAVTPAAIGLVPPPASPTFNGTSNPFLNKAPNPPVATTSAYPGQCGNVGQSTDVSPDVQLNTSPTTLNTPTGSKTGFQLTPLDCAAMAVIQATVGAVTYTAIFPQDSDANGVPDIQQNGGGGVQALCSSSAPCPTGIEDPGATRPVATLTASAASGTATFTTSVALVFTAGDVGGEILVPSTGARATITALNETLDSKGRTTATSVTATITQGSFSAPISAGSWHVRFYSAFDRYRGFIVSGQHVRPGAGKFFFVHLVNPQCLPAGIDPLTSHESLLGGGPSSLANYVPAGTASAYPTDRPLFTNVNLGSAMYALCYTPGATHYTCNEWIDNFQSYTPVTGVVYQAGTNGATSDRTVLRNALYGLPRKGVRLIECVDLPNAASPSFSGLSTSTLGVSSLGLADDNAVIFSRRIVKFFLDPTSGLIPLGGAQPLKYSTFKNGAWITPGTTVEDLAASGGNKDGVCDAGETCKTVDTNYILSRHFEYYSYMEIGHSVSLKRVGVHFVPMTGDFLDSASTNKLDNQGNKFWVPSAYKESTDQTESRR